MTAFNSSLTNLTALLPVTWLQLLRKQTKTATSNALIAETHYLRAQYFRTVRITSAQALFCYLRQKLKTLWDKSCYSIIPPTLHRYTFLLSPTLYIVTNNSKIRKWQKYVINFRQNSTLRHWNGNYRVAFNEVSLNILVQDIPAQVCPLKSGPDLTNVRQAFTVPSGHYCSTDAWRSSRGNR